MPITSQITASVEYKISDIEISVTKRTILVKITKKILNGAVVLSSSNFNVLIQGTDFETLAATIPNGTVSLYDAIGGTIYTYCINNNKFV